MSRKISPLAAKLAGQPLKASVKARCSCNPDGTKGLARILNPTCPVHGHGRPAGRGV